MIRYIMVWFEYVHQIAKINFCKFEADMILWFEYLSYVLLYINDILSFKYLSLKNTSLMFFNVPATNIYRVFFILISDK